MSGMTLTEFLLARIAEDEAAARDCMAYPEALLAFGDALQAPYLRGWKAERASNHMDRWHPARVLAECEARRRIVAEHEHDLSGTYGDKPGCWRCHQDRDYDLIPEGWCLTLRALALPYVDHSDYHKEWRP